MQNPNIDGIEIKETEKIKCLKFTTVRKGDTEEYVISRLAQTKIT